MWPVIASSDRERRFLFHLFSGLMLPAFLTLISLVFFQPSDDSSLLLPLITATCIGIPIGFFIGWKKPSRSGTWIWLIPAFFVVGQLITSVLTDGVRNGVWWVWQNLFTSECADSECLEEAMLTLPLFTSVAYSIGYSMRLFHHRIARTFN